MADGRPTEQVEGPTDEQLWRAFVEGEDAALTALLERYREELYWYLLLSTGKQETAAQYLRNVWALLAGYRRPFEGFDCFKSWLYAAATQNAVPATHPEPFGLTDLLDDIKRGTQQSERAALFFCIRDMTRAVRQPFLLVTVAGLSVGEAAKACNFTVDRTLDSIEKAYRRLARTEPFRPANHDYEL